LREKRALPLKALPFMRSATAPRPKRNSERRAASAYLADWTQRSVPNCYGGRRDRPASHPKEYSPYCCSLRARTKLRTSKRTSPSAA